MIDHDRATTQALGLACLEREVGVVFADNICEGVRVLLGTSVDLVVIDAAALRLTPRELGTLFERVAPDVPVVVAMRPEALEARVALEVAGFRVLSKPVVVEDLLRKVVRV
jgi:DNA-binding NtrC family response regulator